MGYTEYMLITAPELKEWKSIVEDFYKVIRAYENMGFRLRGPLGRGLPIITEEEIAFNGDAECGHSEFEFLPLPSKVKVIKTPYGSFEYLPGAFYCNGDCSHESVNIYRKVPKMETFFLLPEEEFGKFYSVNIEPWIIYRRYGKKVKGYFTFTKTARKPYTIVVQSLFLIIQHYNPDTVFLNTDGEPEDWLPAQTLIASELGYFPEVRFYKFSSL